MDGGQSQINDAIAYWNVPCVITYPMPPYMTLRLQLRINPPPPPVVRPLRLWNMTTKYSSSKGSFGGGQGFGSEETYKIDPRSAQESTIHDVGQKIIIYNPRGRSNFSGLRAVKGGNTGATFKITKYMNPKGKQAVTLKVKDGYLSSTCNSSNGNCELTVENFSGTLDVIKGDTRKFLFLQTGASFQSLVNPAMFISTDNSDVSEVSLSTKDQRKIFDFIIDVEMTGKTKNQDDFMGSGIIIIEDRIAVYIPKDFLDSLIKQRIQESFERVGNFGRMT